MEAWAHFIFGALALGPDSSAYTRGVSAPLGPQRWAFVALDNDFFLNTDRYYTSGFFVGLAQSLSAVTLRAMLGQEIYTPRDISVARPQPDDRPWAGHLYLGADVLTRVKNWPSGVGLRAGVVGPSALAKPMQKLIHYAIAARQPRGWDHQLDNRLAVGFWVAQGGQTRISLGPRYALRLAFGVGGELGTVRNRLTFSSVLQVGLNLERGISFHVREPVVTPSFEPIRNDYRLYFTLTSVYQLIGADVFLEGSGHGLAINPRGVTALGRPGVAFVFGKIRVAIQYSLRTQDFGNQSAAGHYGSGDVQIGF